MDGAAGLVEFGAVEFGLIEGGSPNAGGGLLGGRMLAPLLGAPISIAGGVIPAGSAFGLAGVGLGGGDGSESTSGTSIVEEFALLGEGVLFGEGAGLGARRSGSGSLFFFEDSDCEGAISSGIVFRKREFPDRCGTD
jgi:hypothetical protein